MQQIDHDIEYVKSIDPELVESDPEAARAVGSYMRRSRKRYVSNYWRTSSGSEFYRNKLGRCEDAPCCGCCNA